MKISRAAEGFLLYMVSNTYSSNTITIYRIHIEQMIQHVGDLELSDLKPEVVQAFFVWYKTEYRPQRRMARPGPDHVASGTLYNCWCMLRTFGKWLTENLQVPSIDSLIKAPKKTMPPIQPFTEDEIQRLIKVSEKTPVETKDGRKYSVRRETYQRDLALILVLLDTGARIGEVCRLKVGDYNSIAGELSIRPYGTGKKTHGRVVFLGKKTKQVLWKYLSVREDIRTDEYLFLTNEGKPISNHMAQNMLSKLGKRAGIAHCHPHRFRHTAAIQFLRNGGDVFTLQRLLGHRTLEMTRHYVELADSDSQAAHARSSPVDRWHL